MANRSEAGIDCGRERRLMDSPLILFAFLSLFHILGGGVLGVAMRGLQAPWLLPFQLLELAVVFGVTFFFWDRIRELFGKPELIKIVFGGVFFVTGCAAGGMLLKAGEIPMAAVFGLVFGGVGLAFILPGMRNMVKPPAGPKQG